MMHLIPPSLMMLTGGGLPPIPVLPNRPYTLPSRAAGQAHPAWSRGARAWHALGANRAVYGASGTVRLSIATEKIRQAIPLESARQRGKRSAVVH